MAINTMNRLIAIILVFSGLNLRAQLEGTKAPYLRFPDLPSIQAG